MSSRLLHNSSLSAFMGRLTPPMEFYRTKKNTNNTTSSMVKAQA